MPNRIKKLSLLFLICFTILSCDQDQDNTITETEENTDLDATVNPDETPTTCENSSFLFKEKDALILVEFENGSFETESDWKITEDNNVSGGQYVAWNGSKAYNNPGIEIVNFKLHIETTGTYKFLWNSAVTIGEDSTENNDSWLRFADATDYYGEKSGNRVYPVGTGKTPNPNGSSKEGWFKIYRSGAVSEFSWQAKTSDSDAHQIYVQFNNAGIYTMEVSGRSNGHGIDQFVLYQEDTYSKNEATSAAFSQITCN